MIRSDAILLGGAALVSLGLLLLPLIALNLVLMQSFADRERREQRASAQSALGSARLFLLDYLRGLPLGFDLKTQVDREFMEWTSSMFKHPINQLTQAISLADDDTGVLSQTLILQLPFQ